MSNNIPDFTELELHVVATALKERYSEDIELQLADAEMQIDRDSGEKSDCPVVFWRQQGASFIIYKMGDKRYAARYFYTPREQFRPAEDEYDEVGDCVLALLVVQADHEAQRAGSL